MKVKVVHPNSPLPFLQLGVSAEKIDDIFTVIHGRIDHHIKMQTPRAVVLQEIARLCDTTEELLAILDIFYSYLHENNAIYPR